MSFPDGPGRAKRFDVFLSHSSADKAAVELLAQRLRDEAKLRPFLDKWHLSPGLPWQDELSVALEESSAVAVFVGPAGAGPWHHEEMRLALDRAARSSGDYRVIPVLLPGSDLASVEGFLGQRTWVDFRAGLDDAAAMRRLAAAVRGEADTDDESELPDHPAPYRGLFRFEAEDDWCFFGRDDEIARLIGKLESSTFVAVIGPSGSGKSSLVRAGLIPRLSEIRGPFTGDWRVLTCTPGIDLTRSIAEQVARLSPTGTSLDEVDRLVERFERRADGLATAVGAYLADDPSPVLLFIDQFEELFTLAGDSSDERRARASRVLANIATAVADPAGRLKVVVTLRADFVSTALTVNGVAALFEDHQVLLGELSADGLRQVIVRPAEAVGAIFEQGLVDAIIADVEAEPGALPLLQHALFELWTRRRGPWLTREAYATSGGVVSALSTRAEQVYDDLPPARQRAARSIFIRLTTLGDGVPDTRRRTPRSELYPSGVRRDDVDAALSALSAERARLIVIDGEMVEVAHEALLRHWQRLRTWLDDDREALRIHRRLSEAATAWDAELARDGDALYAGARLAEASDFAEAHGAELNDVERDFLRASSQRTEDELTAQRARARQLRRRLVAAYAAFGLALIGIGLALYFLRQAREQTEIARDQTQVAESQRNQARALALAGSSITVRDREPALALLLAAEAAAIETTPARVETREALVGARRAFSERAPGPIGSPLRGHESVVRAVAVNPASDIVASADFGGTIRLWDPATGRLVGEIVDAHDGDPVSALAFSIGGEELASAGGDGAVRFWDPATGELSREIEAAHGGRPVRALAFAPEADLLASAGDDDMVRLWDRATGRSVGEELAGHTDSVTAVAFSPFGDVVASASSDGTVRLWESATGSPMMTRHDAHLGKRVASVAFAPDSETLASAGDDGSVRLWTVPDLEPGQVLESQDSTLAVAFGPAGDVLTSVGSDRGGLTTAEPDTGTVLLWTAETPDRGWSGPTIVFSQPDQQRDVAVSPDGRFIVSGGTDRTVRLWDPGGADRLDRLLGDGVWTSTFAMTDDLIAVADGDGIVRLWDIDDGSAVGELETRDVTRLEFDPDGTVLAVASRDGHVSLWRVPDGRLAGTLTRVEEDTAHDGFVSDIAFDPDGARVRSLGGDDRILRTWDVDTGALEDEFELMVDAAQTLTFAMQSDAGLVATPDGLRVLIWESSGELRAELTGHEDVVNSVAFNPDGTMLATAVAYNRTGVRGGEVRVFSAVSGELLYVVDESIGASDVDFAPDGTVLIAALGDGTLGLWSAETGDPIGDPIASFDRDPFLGEDLAVSPDGTLVARSSRSGGVHLWDFWDPVEACRRGGPLVWAQSVERFLPSDFELSACVSR